VGPPNIRAREQERSSSPKVVPELHPNARAPCTRRRSMLVCMTSAACSLCVCACHQALAVYASVHAVSSSQPRLYDLAAPCGCLATLPIIAHDGGRGTPRTSASDLQLAGAADSAVDIYWGGMILTFTHIWEGLTLVGGCWSHLWGISAASVTSPHAAALIRLGGGVAVFACVPFRGWPPQLAHGAKPRAQVTRLGFCAFCSQYIAAAAP